MRVLSFGGKVNELWEYANNIVLDVARKHFSHRCDRPPQRSEDTEQLLEARTCRRRELLLQGVLRQPDDPAHGELRALTKEIRARKKRDWKRYRATLVVSLDDAWARRDFRDVHRLARRLTNKSIGPRQRRFRRPDPEVPELDEWREYLCKHPHRGGCSAPAYEARPAPTKVRTPQEAVPLAQEDVRRLLGVLRRAAPRVGVPGWSVPPALWRVLVWPHRVRRDHARPALGALPRSHGAPTLKFFNKLIMAVRIVDALPDTCQHFLVFTLKSLNKHNGKSGCDAHKILAMLDGVGKMCYKAMWRSSTPRGARTFSCGYLARRRREMAVLAQLALGHRLARLRQSHATVFYDMRNAIWCTEKPKLLEACRAVVLPSDYILFEQRILG